MTGQTDIMNLALVSFRDPTISWIVMSRIKTRA